MEKMPSAAEMGKPWAMRSLTDIPSYLKDGPKSKWSTPWR